MRHRQHGPRHQRASTAIESRSRRCSSDGTGPAHTRRDRDRRHRQHRGPVGPEPHRGGLDATMARLTRHGRPEQLPVAIEATRSGRGPAAGRRPPRRSRSTPTPSTPPGPAGVQPKPSPIPATASSWPTTCAPTGTGCAGCIPGCRHPGAAGPVAAACRPCGGQDRCQQPARRPAGGPLARRQAGLFPHRQRHRPGVPGRLSDPAVGRPPRRGPPGRLLPAARYSGGRSPAELLDRLRSAPAAPVGLAPEVLAELVAPRSGCCASCWPPSPSSIGRWGLGCSGMPRPGCSPLPASARSTWPRSSPRSARSWTVPAPRARHGRVRRRTGHQASGKSKAVTFRLGGQHQGPQRPCQLRRQLPAQLTLGGQGLRRRPPPRQAPSPRRPHPRSGLAAGDLGLLAQRHDLRPRQARRRTAARRQNLTQKTQAHPRPPALPTARPDRCDSWPVTPPTT